MTSKYTLTVGGLAVAACILFFTACASTEGKKEMAAAHPNGSKLWAQNCIRCHNSRAPNSYSETQWEVVMLHMRVRANLTAEEHRAILEFLKTAD